MTQRIAKDFLSTRDINSIKNDCFVEGAHNPYGPSDSLRAYGETNSALYVPFAYAKERFKVSPNKDTEFPKINYKFNSKKYPFRTDGGRDQEVVFNEAKKLLKTNRTAMLSLHCGYGKCLAKDTPVLMYDGTIKMVQDVQVGDLLMGDDSKPRKVLTLARGKEEMYKIMPIKGESYTVNKSHILSLYVSGNKSIMKYNRHGSQIGWIVKWFDHQNYKQQTKNFYYHSYDNDHNKCYVAAHEFVDNIDSPDVVDISVTDYLNLPTTAAGMLLGYKVPIDYSPKEVLIDPYILGYWLGNGVSVAEKITTVDQIVLDYNLVGNKHIPHVYKANSRNIRLQLLAGFLDADGSLQRNCIDIIQKSERLATDIVYIVRSLGLAAYMKECLQGESKKGIYYCVTISGNTNMIPTKLPRNPSDERKQNKNPLVTRIKLIPQGIDEYYGFSIDGNRRFVLGDFTVTHNTYTGIRLAHAAGLKCAVLAHRDKLFEQWKESIEKFTTAKVQIVGTDGVLDPIADFYIFNISFVHKKWSTQKKGWVPVKLGIYKNVIGSLIVDEAHVACASEMSRSLLYFNPRIAIALTATPHRKDGMDKALEIYFGKYTKTQIVRIAKHPFTVYRLPTKIKPVFTRNAFGRKDWNSVIKYLVECKERNEKIIKVVENFPSHTIIILTSRKAHCKLLSTMLDEKGITNSIYVGTSKKYDNKARVLLTTYSKSGVGFDDSRLDMEIIACSVTEVEQYAGRLRFDEGKELVIVDFVDDDSNCLKHWQARRNWYISRTGTIKHYYREFPDNGTPNVKNIKNKNNDTDTKKPKRLARRL